PPTPITAVNSTSTPAPISRLRFVFSLRLSYSGAFNKVIAYSSNHIRRSFCLPRISVSTHPRLRPPLHRPQVMLHMCHIILNQKPKRNRRSCNLATMCQAAPLQMCNRPHNVLVQSEPQSQHFGPFA